MKKEFIKVVIEEAKYSRYYDQMAYIIYRNQNIFGRIKEHFSEKRIDFSVAHLLFDEDEIKSVVGFNRYQFSVQLYENAENRACYVYEKFVEEMLDVKLDEIPLSKQLSLLLDLEGHIRIQIKSSDDPEQLMDAIMELFSQVKIILEGFSKEYQETFKSNK